MARPVIIDDDELLNRLAGVFREVGYEAASLSRLAEASALKRASLYHRFPDGKEEMAQAVLEAARRWIAECVVAPLKTNNPPAQRIAEVTGNLEAYYDCGRRACLLNLMSSPQMASGPFSQDVKSAFRMLIDAFASVACDAGLDKVKATRRAERIVMLMQGALVLSRGLNSTEPFKRFLRSLHDELIGA